jgi:hypothetical protein
MPTPDPTRSPALARLMAIMRDNPEVLYRLRSNPVSTVRQLTSLSYEDRAELISSPTFGLRIAKYGLTYTGTHPASSCIGKQVDYNVDGPLALALNRNLGRIQEPFVIIPTLWSTGGPPSFDDPTNPYDNLFDAEAVRHIDRYCAAFVTSDYMAWLRREYGVGPGQSLSHQILDHDLFNEVTGGSWYQNIYFTDVGLGPSFPGDFQAYVQNVIDTQAADTGFALNVNYAFDNNLFPIFVVHFGVDVEVENRFWPINYAKSCGPNARNDFQGFHDRIDVGWGRKKGVIIGILTCGGAFGNPLAQPLYDEIPELAYYWTTLSHELAEALTNPDLVSGWNTNNVDDMRYNCSEIGDLCGPEKVGVSLSHDFGAITVQPAWSNEAGGPYYGTRGACATSPLPAASPIGGDIATTPGENKIDVVTTSLLFQDIGLYQGSGGGRFYAVDAPPLMYPLLRRSVASYTQAQGPIPVVSVSPTDGGSVAFWVDPTGDLFTVQIGPPTAPGVHVDYTPQIIAGPSHNDPPNIWPGRNIAAISRKPDCLDVFWVGADGAIYRAWKTWSLDWWVEQISDRAGVANPSACVSAIARQPMHIDVFYVNTDGAIENIFGDAQFAGAFDLLHEARNWTWGRNIISSRQIQPDSMVAAVARMSDRWDLFAMNVFGNVENWYWSDGSNLDMFLLSEQMPQLGSGHGGYRAITAVSRESDSLDVAFIGVDGTVWTISWWGGLGWNVPVAVTGPRAAFPVMPISMVARTAADLDIFYTDIPGSVVDSTTNGSLWSASWQHPAPGRAPFPDSSADWYLRNLDRQGVLEGALNAG